MLRKLKLSASMLVCLAGGTAFSGTSVSSARMKLFVDKNDAQPRCPGCKTVRISVDSKPVRPGAPAITSLRARVISTQMPELVADFVEFQSMESSNRLFRGTIRVPSLLSSEVDGLSLAVEGWGQKCVNSASLNCSFLKVHDELESDLTTILNLSLE